MDRSQGPVIKLFNWAMKELLGVRRTTTNIVCYAELGYPSLPDLVKYRQHKFFLKIWLESNGMDNDPLIYAINSAISSNTVVDRTVRDMINNNVPNMSEVMSGVHAAIRHSNTSRCVTYKDY